MARMGSLLFERSSLDFSRFACSRSYFFASMALTLSDFLIFSVVTLRSCCRFLVRFESYGNYFLPDFFISASISRSSASFLFRSGLGMLYYRLCFLPECCHIFLRAASSLSSSLSSLLA